MRTARYFLDTEFIEDGATIDLISIGIVSEDGRSLYLQNTECEYGKASDWVWRNVFPYLSHFNMAGRRSCSEHRESYDSGLGTRITTSCGDSAENPCPWAERMEIKSQVLTFCDIEQYGEPEFWGYYAAYDWVAFCQLFGSMVNLPKGFPMYCRDVKQLADQLGGIRIPKPPVTIHNALSDAGWTKFAYEFLTKKQ